MTKYNAILIKKYQPVPVSKGFTKYAADFLIAVKDNTCTLEIGASQLKPINAEVGDEIIIDMVSKSINGGIYYNINPATSYEKSPFPSIKQIYKTVLDENGYDEISGRTFKEYPYREVKICKTEECYWSDTCTRTLMGVNYYVDAIESEITYDIVEADEEIDFTLIRSKDFDFNSSDLMPSGKLNQTRLREALRDYLPIAEHPHKANYSATEIFSYYLYAGRGAAGSFSYGSHEHRCICGHYIEEVCWVNYISPYNSDGIKKPLLGAIGNCCIKHFALYTKLYARLLADIVDNYRCGRFNTMRDISKKNGFDYLAMRFLTSCVLTKDETRQLDCALYNRTKNPLDNAIKRILHHISEFYKHNYNYVFSVGHA